MKTHLLTITLLLLTAIGCQKPITDLPEMPGQSSNHPSDDTTTAKDTSTAILVDASKDGGTWWFPQGPGTGFYADQPHQGQPLADYLRSLGFTVDELPRDAIITNALLEKYSKIIRGPAFFPYSDNEIEAYKNFLKKPGSLLLLQDHLSYTTNDKLSELLGVQFTGAVDGDIVHFVPNAITNGLTELPFIAGSVVTNTVNNPNITVLGSLDKNNYTVLNNSDPFNGNGTSIDPPVMGTLNNYPGIKIFFLGDINGLEGLPQPFTQNLVSWLFR